MKKTIAALMVLALCLPPLAGCSGAPGAPAGVPAAPAGSPAGGKSANDETVGTDEMIDYFGTVAFSGAEGADGGVAVKWAQPIRLQVEGSPTQDQLALLDMYVNDCKKIPDFPGIDRVPSGGNLVITFRPAGDLAARFPDMAQGDAGCFTVSRNGNWEITDAAIGIATDAGDAQTARNRLLRLFMFSLGVSCTSGEYSDSILNDGACAQDWALLDWTVVSFLYTREIAPGESKADALAFLRAD